MKSALLTAGFAAAVSNPATISLQSITESKVAFGGAVINSYCQADVLPTFTSVKVPLDGLHPDGASLKPGTVHGITLTLQNVKVSCLHNDGVSPCATDLGAAEPLDAQFVCKFSSPGHDDIRSAAVQAERFSDTFAGMTTVGAKVNCEIPGRANVDHNVTVSLEYTGKTTVELAYAGRAGGNSIGFADTTAPTAFPTAYPTASPTASPTAYPTASPTASPTATPTASPTHSVPQDCAAGSPAGCTVTTLSMVGTYIPGQLIMVRDGHTVRRSTDTNSCPTNWKVWAPTNQEDLQTAFDSTAGFSAMEDPHFIIDVTRGSNGCGGCGASMKSTTSSQSSWRTTDSRPWFMRNNGYSEPNGDYHANCYLHIYNKHPHDLKFNDGSCGYSSKDYLCQPVLGHYVGY